MPDYETKKKGVFREIWVRFSFLVVMAMVEEVSDRMRMKAQIRVLQVIVIQLKVK